MPDSTNNGTVVYLSDIRKARTSKNVSRAISEERVRQLASEGYQLIVPFVFAAVAYHFLKAQNRSPEFQEELAEALFEATHQSPRVLWKMPLTVDVSYDCYNVIQELNYTAGLQSIRDEFVKATEGQLT